MLHRVTSMGRLKTGVVNNGVAPTVTPRRTDSPLQPDDDGDAAVRSAYASQHHWLEGESRLSRTESDVCLERGASIRMGVEPSRAQVRWRAAYETVVVVSKVKLGSQAPSPGVQVTRLQASDVMLEVE